MMGRGGGGGLWWLGVETGVRWSVELGLMCGFCGLGALVAVLDRRAISHGM